MNRVVSNLTRNALKYANSKVTISFGGKIKSASLKLKMMAQVFLKRTENGCLMHLSDWIKAEVGIQEDLD